MAQMANEKYLNEYRQFFQYFDETLDPNDQLPVKLASYRLFKKEVVGAIFNWTNQYLSDKKCPWHLISFLSRIVIETTRKRCKKQPVQCGFNPSDNAYEPLKLMHTVIEVINEVCFRYKSSLNVQNRQNMAVSYPLPAPEDLYNVVSTSALKNNRRKMEDRLIVIHDLNTIFTKQDATPSHYYAVFDGHDGDHAAVYSANHLHQYLAESTNFTSNPAQAIQDAFCKTDSMFIKKCETEKISGGTTAVCALLLPKEKTLYVAWVGDSQAALVSKGKVLPCVVSHRPDREDERQRIERDGGMVLHWGIWRVNGQLGVSRAIGDAEYKPYVTATPEMVKIPLGGEEDFLVLGSDGLWDYVSEVEIAKVVYDAVHSDTEKAKTVSRELVQLAKQYGSSDNISVIVVFLRDPHQIAAGPLSNSSLVTMDTLDNANNPFAIPNKTNVDGLTTSAQTEDGLLLNFAEGLKKNEDLPNNDLIKMLEKSNRDRMSPDFDKEDNLGPETNVDNPDDCPASPKRRTEALNNNQNGNNPFSDIEKSLELNLNLKAGTFEGLTSPTEEEECVPPANSVHNVSQLIDAAGAESDSEEDDEEWNYVRGEEANKENAKPSQLSTQVAEEEEEEDDIENAMSQLNPNAAEFIPSPARAVASPLGRVLDLEDQVLSMSPKKPPQQDADINVPAQCDFEKDISQKPHETEEAFSNGHQDGFNSETNALNALNSRLDEFHFGPNAAPFTPSKLLDQSEASSTRANFGDESEMTLGTSFNDSALLLLDRDQCDYVQPKDDPMSMSFHQDRSDDSNLFDLNKVHVLPENVDDFIAKGKEEGEANSLFDDTISDLTEHYPLGEPKEGARQIENEFTTDLDREDTEHLRINQSSTPIDDRSQSPSDLRTPSEDERAFSPRVEIKSPLEESKIPQEGELEAQLEECRIKSPSDRATPTEDDRLTLSPTEHKPSSPYEEKELYSTQEEKEVCSPVEEKDDFCLIGTENVNVLHNEDKEVVEEKDLFSEKDIIHEEKQQVEDREKDVIEEKDLLDDQEDEQIIPPVQEAPKEQTEDLPVQDVEIPMETAPTGEEIASPSQEDIAVLDFERQIVSPLERDVVSPIEEGQEPDTVSLTGDDSSAVKEVPESPSIEQEVSTAEIVEEYSREIQAETAEAIAATATCDNLEFSGLDASEPSRIKEADVLEFVTDKSDEDKAKENVECLLQLDNVNTVLSPEEKSVEFPTDQSVDTNKSEINSEPEAQQSQDSPLKEEIASFELPEQSGNLLLGEDEASIVNQSQTAQEIDQVLVDVSNEQQCSLKSTNDTSSFNTASFLDGSMFEGVKCPISPNLSAYETLEAASEDTSGILKVEESLEISQTSPEREQNPDIKLTSTPVADKSEAPPVQPAPAQAKPAVSEKTTNAKVGDSKKPPVKSKVTSSTVTKQAPKTTATRPSLKPAAAKTTTTKTNTATSRLTSTTKTETSISKTASKPLTATNSKTNASAARVPLSSRSTTTTTTKTGTTNGVSRPAAKSSTGAIKKSTEGSSTRSTTSTGLGKTTSTTARSNLASARSATTTAAPKPRPNTLKPASARTVDAPKPTTARTTSTVPRVPLSSRIVTARPTSSKESAGKTNLLSSKPKSVTDKQVKETANKLTAASKTVAKTTSHIQSLAKSSTATKKTEVTGTKTTTRTTTTTTSRAPIKRPSASAVSKTATTKVDKPKQNGVAPVVNEKIIVNNGSNCGLNRNGDQQFVKDNSPVDNKLITDNLSESAAN